MLSPVLVLQLAEEQQMNCPGMELNLPGELDNIDFVHTCYVRLSSPHGLAARFLVLYSAEDIATSVDALQCSQHS